MEKSSKPIVIPINGVDWVYDEVDMDLNLFAEEFRAYPNSKILVVGAHDEPSANLLAQAGHRVIGVDLREYDKKLPPCNYEFIRGDFNDLSPSFYREHAGTFDAFVCLSTLEHFGMGAYKESGRSHRYYDVIAMRKAWELLKTGEPGKEHGKAYLTVPFGSKFMEVWPHWRVYDLDSARDRLVQDFTIVKINAFTAVHGLEINGVKRKLGERLTEAEVATFSGIPPHISTLMVLRKDPVSRLAPDGR